MSNQPSTTRKIRFDLTAVELATLWEVLYPAVEPKAAPATLAETATAGAMMNLIMKKLVLAGFSSVDASAPAESSMARLFALVTPAAEPEPPTPAAGEWAADEMAEDRRHFEGAESDEPEQGTVHFGHGHAAMVTGN